MGGGETEDKVHKGQEGGAGEGGQTWRSRRENAVKKKKEAELQDDLMVEGGKKPQT